MFEVLTQAVLASLAALPQSLCGRRIWLACSGGRDSLALAEVCVRLFEQGRLPFLPQLLHVNHGLQAVSNLWANNLKSWADQRGVPCQILAVYLPDASEQTARQARYDAMMAVMNENDVLMLAHHGDDQAETVLMRLLTGSGIAGLAGMRAWQAKSSHHPSHSQVFKQVFLWRPWLAVFRDQISDFVHQATLPYVDDPTNFHGDNTRSWLRRQVFPLLKQHNPKAVANVTRSAKLFDEGWQILNTQTQIWLDQIHLPKQSHPPYQMALNIQILQTFSLAEQRLILHQWVQGNEPLPPNKHLIDQILTLTHRPDGDHQTQIFWQGRQQGYQIRCYQHGLYRLTQTWLDWLNRPLPAQNITALTASIWLKNPTNSPFFWQLQIDPAFWQDNPTQNGKTVLKLCSIGDYLKQNRALKLAPNRPNLTAKKLFQTFKIPIWLRGNVAILYQDKNAQALALISPFFVIRLNGKPENENSQHSSPFASMLMQNLAF